MYESQALDPHVNRERFRDYRIDGIIKANDDFVLKEIEKMGLFILASNDISLSPEEMLKYYKGQDKVEKGLQRTR